ncbi:MAG: hypothetical protein R2822_12520 [Spirosomataceae bacterium]
MNEKPKVVSNTESVVSTTIIDTEEKLSVKETSTREETKSEEEAKPAHFVKNKKTQPTTPQASLQRDKTEKYKEEEQTEPEIKPLLIEAKADPLKD